MIYISQCNGKICRVTHCFKINNKSRYCLKLGYVRSSLLFKKTFEDSIYGPFVTLVTLRLSTFDFIECKECILPTDTLFIQLSHIRRLVHSNKANFENTAPLDPIFNCSERLWDRIVLKIEETNIMAPRQSFIVSQGIFALRMKLMSELPLVSLDLYPLLSREKARRSE